MYTYSAQTEPQHGFFLMIPATVTNDPDIDDSTAILFGRIAALSNQKGYCWASDQYLADLTRVSVSEVKRRLKKLEDKGHLKRDSQKKQIGWDRKIYPIFNQNMFTKEPGGAFEESQVDPSKGVQMSEEQDKLNTVMSCSVSGDGFIEFTHKASNQKRQESVEAIREHLKAYSELVIEYVLDSLRSYNKEISNIFTLAEKIAEDYHRKTKKRTQTPEKEKDEYQKKPLTEDQWPNAGPWKWYIDDLKEKNKTEQDIQDILTKTGEYDDFCEWRKSL